MMSTFHLGSASKSCDALLTLRQASGRHASSSGRCQGPPFGKASQGLEHLQPFATGRSLTARLVVHATEEPDIAVFRFTLGIPGFDDAYIPRALGVLAVVLLVANHYFSETSTDAVQVRAEALGAVLAALCMAIPTVHQRLQEVLPGRGRRGADAAPKGSAQMFHLRDTLSQQQKQELAWATFALLKNTNTDGLLVCSGGDVLTGRGAFREGTGKSQLPSLGKGQEVAALVPSGQPAQYYPESAPLKEPLKKLLPPGVQSLYVQRISKSSDASFLLLWSDLPRSLSKRDQKWASAIAEKLVPFLE